MRDFHDAKTMARSLRASLARIGMTITHGQSLELMAQAFGLRDWNVLSAAIAAAPGQRRTSAAAGKPRQGERCRCGKPAAAETTFASNDETVAFCEDCFDQLQRAQDDHVQHIAVLRLARQALVSGDESELVAHFSAWSAEQVRRWIDVNRPDANSAPMIFPEWVDPALKAQMERDEQERTGGLPLALQVAEQTLGARRAGDGG